ncbi:MAG: GNAT family N-acetyltransferase [Chloroflexi bacterium]|nr:GNAT family N-acetyltransferase [Chloroflexota bacterium]
MPSLEARPVTVADRAAVASLLRERHTRDLARVPGLTAVFSREKPCEAATGRLFDNPHAEGVAAVRDGRVVGYLFGERMLLSPAHDASRFIEPHSISIPVLGHAVATGEDPATVYRAMYAALAGEWVRDGFFLHTTHIVPGDAELQEAWVALGFGRKITAAVRPTGPVEAPAAAANLDIHLAGPEDLDVILRLGDVLNAHHAGAPVFWPIVRTADAAARESFVSALADPGNPHFVAYAPDGRALGMQTFLNPGFTPPVAEEDGKTIYLFEGVVDTGVRGGGVGTALLDASMRWCREQGYEACCLHYASGNPSGAPFWQGHGFLPVEYTMQRHVDERVAWANR